MGLETIQRKENVTRKDISKGYNEYKDFEGKKYTGMRVITPDKWEFTYATNKRRAWQAPEGSGVPVGTEYHWYLLAHQNVRKLDANSYTTSMEGLKY
jgi:hypothetical protein